MLCVGLNTFKAADNIKEVLAAILQTWGNALGSLWAAMQSYAAERFAAGQRMEHDHLGQQEGHGNPALQVKVTFSKVRPLFCEL